MSLAFDVRDLVVGLLLRAEDCIPRTAVCVTLPLSGIGEPAVGMNEPAAIFESWDELIPVVAALLGAAADSWGAPKGDAASPLESLGLGEPDAEQDPRKH